MKLRKRRKIKFATVCLHASFWLLLVVCIYPIMLIAINSLTPEAHLVEKGYVFTPVGFSLKAFEFLFKNWQKLLLALRGTLINAIGGTALSCIVCALLAYTMTREKFVLRNVIKYMLLVTMFFSAGTIPNYIVRVQFYGLDDSWLIYLLPTAVVASQVFFYRTFFMGIPRELYESARIDGASEMKIFTQIAVPLSLPIIVTQFFLGMVGRWKDYTTTLLYITDESKITLEFYAQRVMQDAAALTEEASKLGLDSTKFPVTAMQFAVVFLTLVPLILLFPLLQKYFEKGAMVGSVKG